MIFLGHTNAENIVDTPTGPLVQSVDVADVVERLAPSVPASESSLRRAGDEVSGDRRGLFGIVLSEIPGTQDKSRGEELPDLDMAGCGSVG